jgi:hypothetical protein
MVVAAFATPFVEALVRFELTYPVRNPLAEGTGLATSLQRQSKQKGQPPCSAKIRVAGPNFID